MVEILVLWLLTKRIGSVVEQKGHKSGWYKVLTIVLWFGGEIIGLLFGVILTEASESARWVAYLFALEGAAVGAGAAYLIAASLPPTSSASLSAPPDLHFHENLRWRLVSNTVWGGLVLAILAVVVFVGGMFPSRLGTSASVQSAFVQYMMLKSLMAALLVPTMALIIASGGLDLSVGAVAGLAAVVLGLLVDSGRVGIGGAFMVALCLTFLVGLVNGFLIGVIRLNAVIVTLAMMTLLRGICFTIMPTTSTFIKVADVGLLSSLVIPGIVLGLLSIFCVAAAELKLVVDKRRSKPDNTAAWIRQSLLVGWPYVLSSVMAGFIGALELGRLKYASPNIGQGLEVDAILMVFLGGTPFGRELVNIVGAVLAAPVVAIAQGVSMLNDVSSFSITISKGAALLFFGLLCHTYYHIVNLMFIKAKGKATSKET